MGVQRRERLVEIGLRGSGNTIGVLTKENLVHIEFENFVFGQRLFDPCREDDFFDLALDFTVAGQQEILHHLLRDRRRTAKRLTARQNSLDTCRGDPAKVVARMLVKVLILSRNKRVLHDIGHFFNRYEQAAFFGEFVNDTAFARINPANGRWRIFGQSRMAWQIVPIDPEDRADAERNHKGRQDEKAENRPEKRKDCPDQITRPLNVSRLL